MSTETQSATAVLEQLEVAELKEHPDNPRKHFDEGVLEEMTASIRQVGVLVPLLVRRTGRGYLILAGARRFRAAQRAGLETVPAIVRDLEDAAALELMLLDNLQRQDLHPLEEAAGFQQLMKVARYDVARVAERVGRSVKYVYDRVKLLDLIPDLKKSFLEGKITAGHAILLARLKPKDQARCADDEKGGLWQHEHVEEYLFSDDELKRSHGGYETVKPCSVRELQGWIDQHVRFEAGEVDPMLFPETAAAIATAEEEKSKIIPITFEHYVQPEAKDANRIYGPRSWKHADGKDWEDPASYSHRKVKSKTCEKSGLGVVVAGEQRGAAFEVCMNRTCDVHFPAQAKKAKKKAARAAAEGGNAQDRANAERAARAEQGRREEEKRARWKKARPAILAAIGAKVKGLSAAADGPLGTMLISALRRSWSSAKSDAVPRGRTAEDLVRHLAFIYVCNQLGHDYTIATDLPRVAKPFGVDAAKILNAEAPPKPRESGSGKTRAKRASKKGGKK